MAVRISLEGFANLSMKDYGTIDITRQQVRALGHNYDVLPPHAIWKNRIGRGIFRIPTESEKSAITGKVAKVPKLKVAKAPKFIAPVAPMPIAETVEDSTAKLIHASDFNGIPVYSAPIDHSYIPNKDRDFVAWGNYQVIKNILSSNSFMSIYLTGETGNGKTMNFEQVAAELGREMIVVNFTANTDEDDLIGGFRLINGTTVWVDGPVVEAMKRGAILLLDEIDLGAEPVMSLQSILQGKSYFIKKLSRLVRPAPGFCVVATANTKGDGSGSNYIWTNPLNPAFLDRFKVTLIQEYPSDKIESKILSCFAKNHELNIPETLVGDLATFASATRAAYVEGSLPEQISTRRLVDILDLSSTLQNVRLAIELATNRFNTEVQMALLSFWDNIDSAQKTVVDPVGTVEATESATEASPVFDVNNPIF